MAPEAEPRRGASRLVLFDLDGTFADTLPDLAAALDRVLAAAGRPGLGEAALRPVVSLGARAMVAHAFADLDDGAELDRHRHRFLDEYRANVARRTRPFPGIPALVEALEARGLRWGIVTNKLADFTEPLLAAMPIAARAACVVSGDSAPRPKPAPDPLLLACARAGEPPAGAVYVGDSPGDVEAAHGAGMPALIAAWGYLPGSGDPETWGAERIAETPAGVLEWIEARGA